ncbi:hypothetical protein AAFC00_000382 [Neodothiora populina]|uniref:Nucleolar protein 16 n=1 Tax=Neodothiora populina TaxID=2781224 RepID=A0ABR3PCR1_9PEZI
MGRELQKKKNRSSVSKVRQKPKSKKKILNNAIIAANWNQKETLTQNYRRLGLAHKLNAATGGTEKTTAMLEDGEQNKSADKLSIHTKIPKMLDVSEVRIERDPETGAILRVIDENNKKPNPLNDPLNDLDDDDEDEDGTEWRGFANEHGVVEASIPSGDGKTAVVRELEAVAARPADKKPRKPSERESEWIQSLVEKHGEDYLAMSRDMKMNPMQQTVGDLKRRVKKWKAAQ